MIRLFLLLVSLTLLISQTFGQSTDSDPKNPLPNQADPGEDSVEFGPIPFEGMDLTWINGQNRQKTFPLSNKVLTGVVYLDTYYNYNFNHPKDNTHTISGTMGRHNEFTVNLASIGVETYYKNIIGRIWLQTGAMLNIVQDLDGTTLRGRNLAIGTTHANNLKYIREAAAGYHFNKWYGLNFEMGIFMSFIGLESYVLQENWCYQRSMVCEFTPFYFSGARAQAYFSKHYKAELWIMNGWQSYGKWASAPALGQSNYYRPNENLQLVANFYYGHDTQFVPGRMRFHHDHSVVYRYFRHGDGLISQAAFSLNNHYGFQSGGSITDASGNRQKLAGPDKAYMAGTSLAHRVWFAKNKFALTLRGDYLTNPSRYLAYSPGVFGTNGYVPGYSNSDQLMMATGTATFDMMPNDFVTFRLEYGFRQASVPYFAGPNGTTSPDGYQGVVPANYAPDLRRRENRITIATSFRL